MNGQKKNPKVAGFTRAVLAENLSLLMEKRYAKSPNKPKSLRVEAGVSLSTVQRILAGKTGPSLDNIENIAEVFELSVYQILLPGLDIKKPQTVKGASQAQARIYRDWRREKFAPTAKEDADVRSDSLETRPHPARGGLGVSPGALPKR